MKRFLSPSEVAELAELLEEAPVRTGVVDEVLQAAEEGRGMTLLLRAPQDLANGVMVHRGPGDC
jgi:hypothetical protein